MARQEHSLFAASRDNGNHQVVEQACQCPVALSAVPISMLLAGSGRFL
jgi:hypothetical protein